MDGVSSSFLTIEFPDGLQLPFQTVGDISSWLQKEQSAFSWLQAGSSRAGAGVQTLYSNYANGRNNMRQYYDKLAGNPDDKNLKQQFVNVVSAFYSETGIRSDHEFVRIASEIEAIDGAIAASAGFRFLMGVDSQINFDTLKGIISAKLKSDGIDPQSHGLVAKAIADLNSVASSERRSSKAEWDSMVSEGRGLLQSTDEEFEKQTSDFKKLSDETVQELRDQATASVSSIQVTEATYKEQMKLQAPVEYWETKAGKHSDALRSSRRSLLIYTGLGSVVLLCVLLYLARTAIDLSNKSTADTAIFLKFAAISAVVTTIGFWVGRVLLRIYLSDRHLLTDAEERIALIKTYLALSNEGKVDASDRALILAPLFRTAADGIVKEEGPDASVAGMIAKALDLRGGR